MPEKKTDNDNPKTTKPKKKRVWLAIIVVLTLIIICFFLSLQNSKSTDEQLAEIEAARAIPDSENAAVIYRRLAISGRLTVARPGYSDARDTFLFTSPWRDKDHPKVAVWLQDRQDVIAELLKASKFEKYRYKEFVELGEVELGEVVMTSGAVQRNLIRFAAQYRISDTWRDLLICAVGNDIAEGRKPAAIEKFLALTKMAHHQRQDTDLLTYTNGLTTEMTALLAIAGLIVEGDVAGEDLQSLEAALPPTKENWARDSQAIAKVYRLLARQFSKRDQLQLLWLNLSGKSMLDLTQDWYLTGLTARRGAHILIALRRHKNRTGDWPESLDEIRSSLSREILTDPQNNGPFVYRPTNEGFTLHSKGKNKIDEAGKFSFIPGGGPDDWPIWPPPTRKTKTTEQNADPNEPATRTEPMQ